MEGRSMETERAAAYAALVDRLVEAARNDPRIKALWLEGSSPATLRPPYASVEAHIAVDEPDFDEAVRGLEAVVGGGRAPAGVRWADVPRFARELTCLLDGFPVTTVVEKTSLLPKRPRAAVASLVDRTGHLYHVMDFSKARP